MNENSQWKYLIPNSVKIEPQWQSASAMLDEISNVELVSHPATRCDKINWIQLLPSHIYPLDDNRSIINTLSLEVTAQIRFHDIQPHFPNIKKRTGYRLIRSQMLELGHVHKTKLKYAIDTRLPS